MRPLSLSFVTAIFMAALMAAPALAQVAGVCPELTPLQRAAGFVTLTNIMLTFAVVLGVGCFLFLFGKWILALLSVFLFIPVEFYEVLGYLAAVGLVVSGHWLTPDHQTWTSLIGCLLFGGMLMLTGNLYKLKSDYVRFFGTLFVLWVPVAVFYHNPHVGFIAVMALMGALGAAGEVIPGFGYVIGFRGKDDLERATTTGFMVLFLFVLLRIFAGGHPFVQVFEQGAIWCGSFVGYLGLLIASSRYYSKRTNWVFMQVITVLLGSAAVAVGSIFGIAPLLGIGGSFFILYLIEKPFDIPVESAVGYAIIGFIVACVLGYVGWWAKDHMDIVRPYLLF